MCGGCKTYGELPSSGFCKIGILLCSLPQSLAGTPGETQSAGDSGKLVEPARAPTCRLASGLHVFIQGRWHFLLLSVAPQRESNWERKTQGEQTNDTTLF